MTPTTISEYLTTSSSSPPSKNISNATLYTVVGYLSVLAVVGSAGNSVVLYVFSKKKDKLTSTLFIIALATVDFITCLVVIPFTVYMEIIDFHLSSDVCCKLYQFFITCNIPFSAFVMVAIAVDRYLCICQPFTRLMTLDRAKVLIGLLAAVAASLGACVAMFFGVYVRSEDVAGNTTELDGVDATLTPLDSYSATTDAAADADNDDGLINSGQCAANDLILSHEFQWYYQKLFTFMYPACLLVVVVLYALIYHSVLRRRYKRQQEKSKTIALVRSAQQTADRQGQTATTSPDRCRPVLVSTVELQASDDGGVAAEDSTLTTDINGCVSSLLRCSEAKTRENRAPRVKSESTLMANLRTAVMLFVVTVVFVVTFLPAFLMALKLIPYNIIVFYFYFANNVANPVIYSFMNQNFHADLKRLLCYKE